MESGPQERMCAEASLNKQPWMIKADETDCKLLSIQEVGLPRDRTHMFECWDMTTWRMFDMLMAASEGSLLISLLTNLGTTGSEIDMDCVL